MTETLYFYWPLLAPLAWAMVGWLLAYKLAPPGWQEFGRAYGWFVIIVCGGIAGPLIVVVDWLADGRR